MISTGLSGVSVQVNAADFTRAAEAFGLAPAAITAALRRSLLKTAITARKEIRMEIVRTERIPARIVNRRLMSYKRDPNGLQQKVWMGIWRVAAGRLGTPRAVRQGRRAGSVVVGRHVFPSAFTQPGNGYTKVMRRTAEGTEEVMVSFGESGAAALGRAHAAAEQRFPVVSAQEINFEFQKLLGRIARRAAR